jgi:hypothetical protein
MNIDQDDDDTNTIDADHGDGPEFDPFATAIALCEIAQRAKPIAAALKKLRKLGCDIAAAEQKLSQLRAEAAAIAAKAESDASAIAEQSRVLDERTAEFEASVAEAHATLRASHDHIADMDRRIRYRILASADLLHGFNERLQDLPDWRAIKQMIPGLPDDLPAPAAEIVSQNVREDWSGNIFSPSTLTRTVRGAA